MKNEDIAETWFPEHEKTLAVVIGTFANYLGYGFGFIFPTFYITTTDTVINYLNKRGIIFF